MKKIIAFVLTALLCASVSAQENKEYLASYFGIKSNGIIDNTTSIQKAIDFIAEKGGGTLTFCVGRYVTGAVYLKSGVNIRLDAAADIVAAESIHAFKGQKAIFNGIGVENVTIYTTRGNGVVDGRSDLVLCSYEDQKGKGFIPASTPVPSLFYFKDSKGVALKDILYRNSPNKDWYISENSSVSAEGCFTDTH